MCLCLSAYELQSLCHDVTSPAIVNVVFLEPPKQPFVTRPHPLDTVLEPNTQCPNCLVVSIVLSGRTQTEICRLQLTSGSHVDMQSRIS